MHTERPEGIARPCSLRSGRNAPTACNLLWGWVGSLRPPAFRLDLCWEVTCRSHAEPKRGCGQDGLAALVLSIPCEDRRAAARVVLEQPELVQFLQAQMLNECN